MIKKDLKKVTKVSREETPNGSSCFVKLKGHRNINFTKYDDPNSTAQKEEFLV